MKVMQDPPPASAEASPRSAPPVLQAAPLDTLRDLRVLFVEQGQRLQVIEDDLRAAEDQIHRLEAELRARNAQISALQRPEPPANATAASVGTEPGAARYSAVQESLLSTTPDMAALFAAADAAGDSAVQGLEPAAREVRSESSAGATGTAAQGQSPEGIARFLVLMEGDAEVVHLLGRRTSIGRGPDNDIQIDQQFVSRHHAIIIAGPNQTVIEDLRSTNGLLVNGQRVRRCTLGDGDVVLIGKTRFRFARRRS